MGDTGAAHMNIKVRTIQPNEESLVSQVAQLHRQEIHDGFLTSLGHNILVDMYKTIATSPGTFLTGAINDDGVLVGFLAGGYGTHSIMREHIRLTGLSAKMRLGFKLMSPKKFLGVLETLKYSESDAQEDLPEAEILNFCVSQDTQRQGVGRYLMKKSQEQFTAKAIQKIRIVTGSAQISAQKFYEKNGAVLVGYKNIHKGMQSCVYTLCV